MAGVETGSMTSRELLRWAVYAAVLGAIFRVAVFVYASQVPIANESGDPVSPVMIQKGSDFSFYLDSRAAYQSDFSVIVDTVVKSLDFASMMDKFSQQYAHMFDFVLSGPVMPILFHVFNYGPETTLPLSLFSLLIGILLNALWINKFYQYGLRRFSLVIFSLLPNAVWYQLNNSADHYLFLFFTLFFVTYYSEIEFRRRMALSVLFVVLMCLTKPNAMPVVAFLLLDFLRLRWNQPWGKGMRVFVIAVVVLCLAGATFYLGYFVAVMKSTMVYQFFGVAYVDYLSGIYGFLPDIIDKPLSWLTLLGAKLLYFVGLRPSWGITPDLLVLIRATPGLILLPGLIWLFIRGDRSMALLVGLFIVPPFLGPAQERYNLSIHPILFMSGVAAYSALCLTLRRRIFGHRATVSRKTAAAE